MDRIVVVVKGGMVQELYASHTCNAEVEIIDLDLDQADTQTVKNVEMQLQTVQKQLSKIY